MKNPLKLQLITPLILFAATLLCVLLSPEPTLAGTGKYTDGKFNFCVSVRFNATDVQLQKIRQRFEAANKILADVTDGQHQFGTISIINNSGASDEAEFWIHPGGAIASAPMGGFGYRGQHINLFLLSDINSSGTFSDYTIAHEFGHSAYDLADEYYGTKRNIPAECAPLSEEGPNLNYCLMDGANRGGTFTPTGRIYSVNEFCVASNHDPDRDTSQHAVHGESCWETMSKLMRKWRLRSPNGLPQSEPPTAQPVIFNTSCQAQTRKTMLLIDRSGSMITDNRLKSLKYAVEYYIRRTDSNAFLARLYPFWKHARKQKT